MTKYHEDNRIYFEGWKSDKCWKVNRRVVLPYYVEHWGYPSGFHIRWGNTESLMDIDRAMCVVGNMRLGDICTVVAALQREFEHSREPGIAESTFFDVRFYKKGTVHLKFKDEDLWKKFNLAAAKGRAWLPPGEHAEPSTPTKAEQDDAVDRAVAVPLRLFQNEDADY